MFTSLLCRLDELNNLKRLLETNKTKTRGQNVVCEWMILRAVVDLHEGRDAGRAFYGDGGDRGVDVALEVGWWCESTYRSPHEKFRRKATGCSNSRNRYHTFGKVKI